MQYAICAINVVTFCYFLRKTKYGNKLREKPLQDGRLSLYLDIYEDGIRRYEFLKLYIYPETNDKIKAQNRKKRGSLRRWCEASDLWRLKYRIWLCYEARQGITTTNIRQVRKRRRPRTYKAIGVPSSGGMSHEYESGADNSSMG